MPELRETVTVTSASGTRKLDIIVRQVYYEFSEHYEVRLQIHESGKNLLNNIYQSTMEIRNNLIRLDGGCRLKYIWVGPCPSFEEKCRFILKHFEERYYN